MCFFRLCLSVPECATECCVALLSAAGCCWVLLGAFWLLLRAY